MMDLYLWIKIGISVYVLMFRLGKRLVFEDNIGKLLGWIFLYDKLYWFRLGLRRDG